MLVSIYNTQKRFPINHKSVASVVESVITNEGRRCDEVAIHFVGTKKICALHADFFDDPTLTDCISFPMDSDDSSGYQVLGEVFVCPETAFQYTKKHGGELYNEITLYVIHGILHLLGYDDIDVKDRQIMRERESYHMKKLEKQALILKRD